MASIFPFQDLNLLPDPIPLTSSAVAGNPFPAVHGGSHGGAFLIPKLEPKLEPLDEPYAPPLPQFPFSKSSNGFFAELTPSLDDTIFMQESDTLNPHQYNVYSEFYRISELFKSAFAKKLQKFEEEYDLIDSNSKAIVPASPFSSPVPPPPQTASTDVILSKKRNQRSSELVRIIGLGVDDRRCFREIVRKTRILYDSVRIYSMSEEEKRRGLGMGKRLRGDLKSASMMKDRGLWLNRDKRIVGSIPGVEIGDLFFFRMELCVVGLHGQAQAGIDYVPASQSSNGEPIATSIIVSGGYEDDEDSGDMIIYTGQGGQDKHARQCVNQRLEGGNLALQRSMHYGIELRVIRGFKYEGSITGKVYVYDGLYKIFESWFDVGRSGFGVYKYKLLRIEGQPEMGSSVLRFAENLRTRPLFARPVGYVNLDISTKKENLPILLYNDIDSDHEPLYYEYIVGSVLPPFLYHNVVGGGCGCDCVGGCGDACFCSLKNGGEFAYDQNGILSRGKPLVFECGSFCHCPPTCRNRVSQRGMKNRLEVFRSRETGWGVRSLDLIPAGVFICEYAGVVLTREQATVFTMNGDSLIYPSRFTDRWAEWGDLSQIFPDYIRPLHPSLPPLDFAMDVSRMRNVACYISHSSCPNVLVQFVLYDHNNILFPRLMLFAMENIAPLKELSLDYGVSDEWAAKLQICD